jgi:hypothetical protein
MKKNRFKTLISEFIISIANDQIQKSEETKVGFSGTSVYADHENVMKLAKRDQTELKKIFKGPVRPTSDFTANNG